VSVFALCSGKERKNGRLTRGCRPLYRSGQRTRLYLVIRLRVPLSYDANIALECTGPSLPLPSRVMERPKTGFGTPIEAWLSVTVESRSGGEFLPLLWISVRGRWAFDVAAA
jgi:hypothetical protein